MVKPVHPWLRFGLILLCAAALALSAILPALHHHDDHADAAESCPECLAVATATLAISPATTSASAAATVWQNLRIPTFLCHARSDCLTTRCRGPPSLLDI